MSRFYEIEPSLENYWRAIILFGRNSATYKFALAQSLYNIHDSGKSVITLDELAETYAKNLCKRLKEHPKQITREKSAFLDLLKSYNEGETTHDEMIRQTVRYGFVNVIDAFHNVHGQEVGARFFIDDRKSSGSIQLTDDFFRLGERFQFGNLQNETEARWRLVETAWENNISTNLMLVEYYDPTEDLIGVTANKRINVTSARSALNGYQKGRCFYCYKDISVVSGCNDLADVDHFFPNLLKGCDSTKPIDGVANLVLACQDCNRGSNGKFERIPTVELLDRLYNRNEYLIKSHHPLRETLIAQTGSSSTKRQEFLQMAYNCSSFYVGAKHKWQPIAQGSPIF